MYHMVIIKKQKTFISSGTNLFFGKNVFFYKIVVYYDYQSVGGIVVSIVAFQAIDPGSIPGRRIDPFFPKMVHVKLNNYILSAYH